MRVLVGCEFSGVVRRAFAALGHDAWSCDLLLAEDDSPKHIRGDVRLLRDEGWDLAIFHPPCTYLCRSGARWHSVQPGRELLALEAIEFVRELMSWPVARIGVENPRGRLSSAIRPPDQVIQPYDFGDDASKETHLWLKGLPKLQPTGRHPPRKVVWQNRVAERWGNQSPSGASNTPDMPGRWRDRSRTYPGIAAAMAAQWSDII